MLQIKKLIETDLTFDRPLTIGISEKNFLKRKRLLSEKRIVIYGCFLRYTGLVNSSCSKPS